MTKRRFEILGKLPSKSPTAEDIISLLLTNRGLKTPSEITEFLNPSLDTISVQLVKIEAKMLAKTLARIKNAIARKETIIVFGDYDVDGITGTAIIWETLFGYTKQVFPYIPDRIEEGYGLSVKGIENVREKYPETSLIITVDNGIVAHKAVAFAKQQNIDVIITDHHVKSETVPDAYSVVHTTNLCGAGVAYLLSQEIKNSFKNSKNGKDDDRHLELAALGTVADLVPLTGANRAIVKFGLEKLRKSRRPGLRALYQLSGIDVSSIDTYTIGHMIAPRLNATGRLASAMDSLRLLCTNDNARAMELADYLEKTNRERQLLMRQATDHAVGLVRGTVAAQKIIIVAHESYQQGVIGLVAGRLVEEYYRPAIVISLGDKESKASARSIKGFNIIETLRTTSQLLVDVGGHPMAAGFTIETQQIDKFRETLENISLPLLTDEVLERKLRIDCELPFTLIGDSLYKELLNLAPFGMGNSEPVFVTKDIEVQDIRAIGRDGSHLKLTLQHEARSFDAIAFGMGELASKIAIGDTITVAYAIDKNTWNGRTTLQLKVREIEKD